MEAFEVRTVSGEHWREWREIRLRSLQDTPTAFGSTYERELAFTEHDWRSRLEGSGPAVLAYADDASHVPIGMGAGFEDLPGWLHVVAMWTDPAWRGRGVGSALLRHLIDWAAAREMRVHLDVTVGNDGARTAYLRNGFEPTGETRPLREGSPYQVERMVLPSIAHP
jgi:GNAT superfamily N-acetyltransferase